MKVRYIGDTYKVSLVKGSIYNVLAVEEGCYRIIDETGEDYLFSKSEFEIVK